MLIDIVIYIICFLLYILSAIFPSWNIWPSVVTNGIHYILMCIAKLQFLIPVDDFFSALSFLMQFLTLYFSAYLFVMILNYFRGTGRGIDV